MKIPLIYKISFALSSGLIFAFLNSLVSYFVLEDGFSASRFVSNMILFGIIFGFGYLFLMKKLTARLMKKISIDLFDIEEKQFDGPATLIKDAEGVGGKLVLTDQRLVFKSYQINIQSGANEYLLAELREVHPRKSAKLFQNEMRIITTEGQHYDFVVYERDLWVSKINIAIQSDQQ